MLLSRASQFSGFVPDYSFGRIDYFCNGLSTKTDKEKTKVIIQLDKGLSKWYSNEEESNVMDNELMFAFDVTAMA